jgi:hypothetical protein
VTVGTIVEAMAAGRTNRRIAGWPVLAGLLAGMFLSVGVSYLLRSLSYGFDTIDGISFAGVSLLFPAIAQLAAYRRRGKPCASTPWWR